jgi:hypothetical protein
MQARSFRCEHAHALAEVLPLQSEAGGATQLLAGGPCVLASLAFHPWTAIELTRCAGYGAWRLFDAKVSSRRLHPSAFWQACRVP